MAALPYLRMYCADWDADTSHLTAMQDGIYWRLVRNYWQRGGPLPADDKRLANIARISMRDWRNNRDAILEFFTVQENTLVHSRLQHELARVQAKSLKNQRPGNTNASKTKRVRDANETRSPIYTDTEADIEQPNGCSSAEPDLTPQMVVEAWNERMVPQGFPAVRRLTGTRLKYLNARIRDNSIEDFQKAMGALERSRFCRGENRNGWHADFDFFVQERSFTKLTEGSYDH